jgi:hypothetical protein
MRSIYPTHKYLSGYLSNWTIQGPPAAYYRCQKERSYRHTDLELNKSFISILFVLEVLTLIYSFHLNSSQVLSELSIVLCMYVFIRMCFCAHVCMSVICAQQIRYERSVSLSLR